MNFRIGRNINKHRKSVKFSFFCETLGRLLLMLKVKIYATFHAVLLNKWIIHPNFASSKAHSFLLLNARTAYIG